MLLVIVRLCTDEPALWSPKTFTVQLYNFAVLPILVIVILDLSIVKLTFLNVPCKSNTSPADTSVVDSVLLVLGLYLKYKS